MYHIQEFSDLLILDGLTPRTISGYLGDLKRIFSDLGNPKLKDITSAKLAQWDTSTAGRYKHNTRSRLRISLRRYLKFLCEQHGHPPLHKELKNLQPRLSDPYLLHTDDLVRILHSLNEKNPVEARDAALIVFLASTGIRREELTLLRMSNIYLSAKGENFIAQVPTSKHDGQVRIINFGNLHDSGDLLAYHFGLWFIFRLNNLGGTRAAGKLPLFSSLKNQNKPLSPQSINDSITRACSRANERLKNKYPHFEKITPHSFRHFFATQSQINGMDLIATQYYMGHNEIKSTTRYVHLAEKSTALQALKFSPTKGLKAKPTLAVGGSGFMDALRLTIPRLPS